MSLKMMYITNNPTIAHIAEKYSVDRIWVDLEQLGKAQRQGGMNTVQSNHTMEDVSIIRETISSAELLVRINPMHEGSYDEIKEVISRGADIVMLPYYKTYEEAAKFIDYCHKCGNVKTILLLETIGAEECLKNVLDFCPPNEIHIGLNDLHIEYKNRFMFELLANGKVEEICNIIKPYGVKYGFGGIARIDEGMLPARHIIGEHYRLGSSMTILSRSFYNPWISNDMEEIERVFKYGLQEIREYELRLQHETPLFFESNKKLVKEEVESVLRYLEHKI